MIRKEEKDLFACWRAVSDAEVSSYLDGMVRLWVKNYCYSRSDRLNDSDDLDVSCVKFTYNYYNFVYSK